MARNRGTVVDEEFSEMNLVCCGLAISEETFVSKSIGWDWTSRDSLDAVDETPLELNNERTL